MTIWLGAVALLVGILIGTVGIGGILLIPALELLTPLSIQASMATATARSIRSSCSMAATSTAQHAIARSPR